jgi:hypothetical protein
VAQTAATVIETVPKLDVWPSTGPAKIGLSVVETRHGEHLSFLDVSGGMDKEYPKIFLPEVVGIGSARKAHPAVDREDSLLPMLRVIRNGVPIAQEDMLESMTAFSACDWKDVELIHELRLFRL